MSFGQFFVPRKLGVLVVSFLVALALVIVPAESSAALDPPTSEPFTPNIGVSLHGDMWGQNGWVGPNIQIEIERPSNGASYSTVYDIGAPSPDEWHFDLYAIWDVQPGDEFLVTDLGDAANVKFHRVHDFSIGLVDKASATVSGSAPSGTELVVKTFTPIECDATVVADTEDDWTYTFAPECMLEAAEVYGHVEVFDADDLDHSVIAWSTDSEPGFWFSVETPGDVRSDGEQWPDGAIIDLAILDESTGVVYTDSTSVGSIGSEPWDVGFRFDLTGFFKIEARDEVSVTSDFDGDGTLDVDQSLLVADIGLVDVDSETGIVSGYTDAGVWIEVTGGNASEGAWRYVQADGVGFFAANLAIPVADGVEGDGTIVAPFADGTGGTTRIWDEDGDATLRGWCVGCGYGSNESPSIAVSVWPDTSVRGWAWQGATLDITLDKTPEDPADSFQWTLFGLTPETYEEGMSYNGWDFELRAPFWDGLTLDPGDVLTVTATGGEIDGAVKILEIVGPFSVDQVDREARTVAGTAPMGELVNVTRWGDDVGHPHAEVKAAATGDTWTATLPGIWAGSTGGAAIWDDDGDATEATWGAPFIATGVANGPEGDGTVYGGYWYLDESVTVEIARDGTSSDPIHVQVLDDWWRGLDTDNLGFDLQVDDVVTVTGDDSDTANTHTVLSVTGLEWEDAGDDGSGNTVSGTTNAPEGSYVRVSAHDIDAVRSTQVDSDGSWFVDFDDPSENSGSVTIEPGVGGVVEVLDDAGDRTVTEWGTQAYDQPGTHWFSVETPYQVWSHGEAWPVGVVIDLTIDDLSGGTPFTDSTQVVSMGSEPWEVGFNFNLDGTFDIQPDDVVTITSDFENDGILEVDRELVVSDLSAVDVNAETGLVSGYAPYGAWVNVNAGNEFESAWRDVQAVVESSTDPPPGYWEADLTTDLEDGSGWLAAPLVDGTGVSVQFFDDDGDSTHRSWCFGCDDGGGEPGPEHRQIEVYREFDMVLAWESEFPLSLTVERGGAEVYSDAAFYGFDLWQDGFELEVNDLVTVTDGDTTKEHVVRSQTVNGLLADPDNPNRVTGTAEPNTDVNIRYNTIRSELSDDNIENATVTANASGDWSYDFVTDVIAGTAVEVSQGDSPDTDNDVTAVVAYVPLPTITAHPSDFIVGEGWPVDAAVSITVGEGFVVDPNPLPEQQGGFPWNTYFETGLHNVTANTDWVLEPDHVVTATNGVSTKAHTVTGLTVDGVDYATNIVFGYAEASSEVQVALWGTESDPHVERVVSADATTGYWEVNFSTAIGPDEWQQARIVTLESQGGAWQSDDDGDATQINFGPEGGGQGGAEPILIAQAEGDIWIRGGGYDGLGPLEVRVIDEPGLPACLGTMAFEGEFEASGADMLCDGGEFVGGHHIGVYTSGAEGLLIRDFAIHDVRITAVDVDTDSVSGLGTPGVQVQAGIYEEGEFEDESVTLALRYVMPDETDGTWTVFFNQAPDEEAGEIGEMGIDGREGDARQFEEDGDFTESQWADRQPQLFVNPVADLVFLGQWPAGPDGTLEVFESDADDAILVHEETIAALGPYYVTEVETDLGGIDLLSGHHVVVSNGIVERSHTVTEISITSFDFENDTFTGTAFIDTTVAASVWNDTSGGNVGDLLARPWIADFTGQVDFSEYNRISGFVGEFDAAENATFFMFEAEYEKLTPDPSETSVTTADGSVTIENLGEGDQLNIITGSPPGSSGGFEYVGETLTIESTATGTPGSPLILTLRIRGDDIPLDLDPEDIVVFKDDVEVSNCVLPLDTADDFPCVSERLRLEPSGDIELTVQTLSFSTWTMAFRSVTIAQFTTTAEPVAVGTDVTATGAFLDVGKTQATGLTSTVTWHEGGECEVVPIIDDGIAASHTYLEAGVFTPTLRLYAGSATDCATAESFELIDEAPYQYVVVYDPDGGFVTGGGWIYSTAGSYVPDPTLEGVATFGFVSKYKKGATVPTGNTEFQFHAGDLNFRSSTYDWLVVTGTPTATFKGVGTINGMGEYKFVIWAGDGESDTFRIKIWSEDGDVETVIYDNGSGQTIGGGSVVIHSAKK